MIKQRRAYFRIRSIAQNFFNKVQNVRKWPNIVAWQELPGKKGFAVYWYE